MSLGKETEAESAAREPSRDSDFALSWIGLSTGPGERRQITVIACGFARPPAPHAGIDPEELAEALDRRRRIISKIVARLGGSMARADPELQVACWGWPVAREDDARLAVSAALEITAMLEGDVRCGADAGIAVTQPPADGQIGIGVIGEVVHHAVALQQGGPSGAVVIGAALRRLVADAFELAVVDAPGGLQWRVTARAASTRIGALPDGGMLVARDTELAMLAACWRAACAGEGRGLRIVADAGVGKSALVTSLLQSAAADGARPIEAQCAPETQDAALAPIRQLATALMREAPGAVPPLPPELSPSPAAAEASPDKDLSGVPRDRLVETLLALISRRAAASPLLIVVEDLHWADGQTLQVLDDLAAHIEGRLPVLLLTTSRSPVGSAPQIDTRLPVLVLDRLSAADLDLMLAESSLGARLPATTRWLIAEQAEGVPLYAWELAHLCTETPHHNAHHRLLAQPNRLNAALAGRLDALATLKPLAQAAAVLGREFDKRLLAAVLEMDVRVLAERLDMLAGLGILVRSDGRADHIYRFAHAMLWLTAYGSVLKARRRQLHTKAAAELTRSFAALAAAEPDAAAYHFKKAGDHRNAFAWWRKAALQAAGNGPAATVIAHVNEALTARIEAPAACTPLEEAELLSLLGAQLVTLRGSASAETVAAYDRALEVISGLPSRPAGLSFDVGWGLTAIHLIGGNIREALPASTRLVELARDQGHDDALVAALRMHGTARLLAGRVGEATELFRMAVSIYDRAGHAAERHRYVSDQGAVSVAHLAMSTAIAGDIAASLDAQRRALDLAGALGHPHTGANVLGVLASAAMHREDHGTAAALAHAARAISTEHGYEYWMARAALILAWKASLESPGRGLDMIVAAAHRYHRTGSGRASVLAYSLVADIALKAGQPDRALEAIAPVKAVGEALGEWIYVPELLRHEARARLALEPSATDAAMALLDRAYEMARSHGSATFAARAAATKALYLTKAPEPRPAQRLK